MFAALLCCLAFVGFIIAISVCLGTFQAPADPQCPTCNGILEDAPKFACNAVPRYDG